jgi:TM2 domain-containing membrane protein YozV
VTEASVKANTTQYNATRISKQGNEMAFCRACGHVIHESATSCPSCGAPQQVVAPKSIKSQTVAVLLTAFLGGFGIHRFYLGKPISGIFYFLFSWTGLPSVVAVFEVFLMTFMSQEAWARKYNLGVLSAPIPLVIKIVAVIIPIILITGLFSEVAIPVFETYKIAPRGIQT